MTEATTSDEVAASAQPVKAAHSPSPETAASNQRFMAIVGAVALMLGIAAVIVPQVFSVAIELLVGIAFLGSGVAEFIRAISNRNQAGWVWAMVAGAICAALGLVLLLSPFAGLAVLTAILAVAFAAKGLIAITYSLSVRPLSNWGWLTMSGIASIAVAALIGFGWPTSTLWALGLLAGIELIAFGLSLVMVALAVPQETPDSVN